MAVERGDTRLARVRALLDAARGQEWVYRPRPCLPETELRAWETVHGVALPFEYGLFLTTVGDGGVMPGSYCNFLIKSLQELRGGPGAATPFPVAAIRLQQRLQQLKIEGQPENGVLFPELELSWQEGNQPPGCLVFGQYPSSDALLLVTAGDLVGSVWCSVCFGVPELSQDGEPRTFLDWFADVLAEFTGGP